MTQAASLLSCPRESCTRAWPDPGCGVPPKLQGLVPPSKDPTQVVRFVCKRSYPSRHFTGLPTPLKHNTLAPGRVEHYSLQTMTPFRSSRLHTGPVSHTSNMTNPNLFSSHQRCEGEPKEVQEGKGHHMAYPHASPCSRQVCCLSVHSLAR